MVEGPRWPCPLQSGTVTVTLSCLSWSPKCWEEEGSTAGMGRAVPCPPASAPSMPRGTRSSFRTCFGFAFHLGALNHHPVKAKLCVIPCVTGCTCRLEPTFRFLGSGSSPLLCNARVTKPSLHPAASRPRSAQPSIPGQEDAAMAPGRPAHLQPLSFLLLFFTSSQSTLKVQMRP